MTTWYTAQGPEGAMWSYSVRPDIWPAGTCAWVIATGSAWLADFGSGPRSRPDGGHGVPGAAEALILGARVHVLQGNARHLTWTPEAP